MPDPSILPPVLLPAPRQLVLTGGRASVPATFRCRGSQPADIAVIAQTILGAIAFAGLAVPVLEADSSADWLRIHLGADTGPGGEGYRLALRPDHADLSAAGLAGVRHGCQTLRQILVQFGTSPPCLEITDAPAFPVRGVVLDLSRDRVPTMPELERLIDTLAGWKINHLQFYTEHTFAYSGHEAVWAEASPLTSAEVQRLDARCQQQGITLAANQNCLGHLERWFEQPRYQPLAEIPPGQSWDFAGIATKTGPFSLCPIDPGSIALVDDLLGQLLPNFTAPWVNIGCDEAFDVGQGRSASAVAQRGRAAVYLDHVRAVCAIARRHGKRPQFWADIALEHPEALRDLPRDLVSLAWGYEADAPFARWCRQVREVGNEVWVCPGTSCWRSITGRTADRRANLLAAAREGIEHGATGYLTTAWGDLGHRQQWPLTVHGLAEGAHRAWSGTAELPHRAVSLHAHGDRTLTAARWFDDLGDVDRELRLMFGKPGSDGGSRPLRNATALFTDLHRPFAEPRRGSEQAWRDAWEYLLPLRNLPTGVSEQVQDELRHTWEMAAFAVRRALARDSIGDERSAQRRALGERLRELIAEHRRLWALRSRPGGLERSVAYYTAVLTDLEA